MSEPPPPFSVIVVSFSRPAILERCLLALTAGIDPDTEVLVVRAKADTGDIAHRFPRVRWIAAAPAETVPRMRALAIRASRGDIVALLEDDCLVADGWCDAMRAAHKQPAAAIGGPIEPGGYEHARDWALYFCEYGRFMKPFAGTVDVLPGNNVSYKRAALAMLSDDVNGEKGFYDTFAHDRLRAAGERLLAVSNVFVTNINSWPRTHLTVMPYHHGRGYAALRFGGKALGRRLAFSALTAVLPAVKTARIAREVLRRHRLGAEFVQALPAIMLFNASWAAGECVGSLFGAGRSVDRWR